MSKFKVGDRVRITDYDEVTGHTGTIARGPEPLYYRVMLDDPGAHDNGILTLPEEMALLDG
jgi:hypothetical protein